MVAGILSAGAEAVTAGVLPTPAIAYLTRALGFDAGVVISASHNSYEFNGIKFFDAEGYKLPDALEDEIERRVCAHDAAPAEGREVGRHTLLTDGEDRYVAFVKSTLKEGDLSGLGVVVDCANGAACCVAARALRELGANVTVICDSPNGVNINENCGSTHLRTLSEAVTARKNAVGVAFDGDADRMLAVDENGRVVDGDMIMTVCARDMMARNELAQNTVVVTVMSNLGMWRAAEKLGLSLEQTRVGDRYVLERMREGGFNFGGEQSGHMIFSRL